MANERIIIDEKYGISIQDNGSIVYLTRHGTNWHEPVAQKPWIAAAYELQRLRKALKDLLDDCDTDPERLSVVNAEKALELL